MLYGYGLERVTPLPYRHLEFSLELAFELLVEDRHNYAGMVACTVSYSLPYRSLE